MTTPKITARTHRTDWGPWHLTTPDTLTCQRSDGHEHDVNITDCTSSAAILQQLVHMTRSPWGTPEAVAGLITALDDVLHLQANLCPNGEHHTITSQAASQAAADWPTS